MRTSTVANLSRGFDAQVNGAMISVPTFRRDFGYVLCSRRSPIIRELTIAAIDTFSKASMSYLQTGRVLSTSFPLSGSSSVDFSSAGYLIEMDLVAVVHSQLESSFAVVASLDSCSRLRDQLSSSAS